MPISVNCLTCLGQTGQHDVLCTALMTGSLVLLLGAGAMTVIGVCCSPLLPEFVTGGSLGGAVQANFMYRAGMQVYGVVHAIKN